MDRAARWVVPLGLVIPLGAALLYWSSDGEAPRTLPSIELNPPPAISTQSPSRNAAAEVSAMAPVPSASSTQDVPAAPVVEEFQRPSSEEQYWAELERLQVSDKQRALDYALAGEDWYDETGKPAEARRAMIVTLLVDLGRMDEARERTYRFIEQYPKSPYRRLVQGATGIHPRPGRPPAPPVDR